MHVFVSILLLITTPCCPQFATRNITGNYFGARAQSKFIFSFAKDSTFLYSTYGHFGKTKTAGTFSVSGDSIYLTPYPKEKQKDKNALNNNQILLIDGDSCIIDVNLRYDYCKLSKKEKYFYNSKRKSFSKAKIDK